MFTRLLALLAFVFCCSISYAEEPMEIPLSEIWADSMPGTINIFELEGAQSEYPLMQEIRAKHGFGTWTAKAGPAFAVAGTGQEALNNAHAVITGKQPPSKSFQQGRDTSIVFFDLASNNYVHLTKVVRDHNTIRVRYEFIPQVEEVLTRHFAIIPTGKLPRGHYKVDIAAEPFGQRFLDAGFKEIPDERKLPRVSSSFEFHVN